VDAVFAPASSAEARRGLYVDVTQARNDVTIMYGKDDVHDFGDLLARAQRDNGKVLVRDVARDVTLRLAHERQRAQEIGRKRGPEIDLGRGPRIGR